MAAYGAAHNAGRTVYKGYAVAVWCVVDVDSDISDQIVENIGVVALVTEYFNINDFHIYLFLARAER